MRILNFGSCNIDYVYSIDHIVQPGETTAASRLELFCGGKGLNQSIAAAKAGAKVFHAGCIGSNGGMLRSALIENNVDVSCLQTVDVQNGHAMIQVCKSGENSIILYSGANALVSKSFIDEVLDRFTADDLLLLQNEISNVDYLIESAFRRGMPIALNPAPFDDSLKQLDLNMLSYIILNEVEALGFTGKSEPEEVISFLQKRCPHLKIILTLGRNGCIYADTEQTLYQPAFKVETVDTTAAGDTFIGYFLSGITQGITPYDAIRHACAASALTVSRKGAAPAIPQADEVILALKSLRPRVMDKTAQLRQKIHAYIDANIRTACLEELAQILHYSRAYTGDVVKQVMNNTFSQILQEKRCSLSARLLRETELSVDEIIHVIGYQNKSFYRKKFQEIYGQPPYQYRKMMQKNAMED